MENIALRINVELFITTMRTTTVNVRVRAPKYKSSIDHQFSITAGQVKQLFFEPQIRMSGTSLGTKGIWVTADDEVVIYGVNKETYSNDAFLGLPVDVLGDEYYVACWWPPSRQCEVLVVGTQDSTSVTITLSQHLGSYYVTYNGIRYYKGNQIRLTIDRFSTFQITTYGDLTGSKVTSNKPVAVFSGNRKTNIGRGGSSDHLVEHWPPVSTWGKKFATVPVPERTVGDKWKFVGSDDNTYVSIKSRSYSTSFTVNAGRMVEKQIPSGNNYYCYIESDKPILVVQFCQSQQSSSEQSDPMMMMIPPIEQYGADYTFTTPKYSLGSYINYFMFIITKADKSGLRLDGSPFPSGTRYNDIPNTNPPLVGGYIKVSEGSHTIRHTSPIKIFGGFLYGRANYETYGFTTGMRLAPINTVCIPTPTVVGDGIDNDCDGLIDEELCTVENRGADDDGDGVAEEDCATPPPIDGVWSSWGSYSSCSQSCKPSGSTATGTRSRTRLCNNPAPKYDGKQCPGSGTESQSCSSSTTCPIHGNWGSWGSWGSCSVTCASGTKTRSRSCNNPSPAYGGNNCAGSSTSSTSCTLSACPIDGGYTSWGSWGSCSRSCGGGSQSRSRSCTNPAPQYGGANCVSSSSSSQSCNTHNCPIHGNWASWAAWGTCTVTCGGGSQTRSRTCSNPTPQYGGNTCSGSGSSSQSCNTHHCPIDGGWDTWTSWTTCTVTCGGGTQSRTRGCTNPTPQYGGAYCGGSSFDLQACNTQNCPIDGAWATWSAWSTCPVSCGGSTQSRSRTCTNPSPQYGGANCGGSGSSSQSCNTNPCPIDGVWTSWTSWSTCTVTCGGGTQDKTRTCTNPAPQHGGAACAGNSSDTQDCNTQVCIIDGAWGAWTSWGTCTVTCGTGRQSRSRVCDDPRPANGGLNCTGDSSDYQDCNNQTCPVAAAGQYVQLCPSGWFTCESGAMTCINMMFVCDCDKDCDDGSDETTTYAGCSATIMSKCPSGVDHISASYVSMVICLLASLFALLR